MSNMLPSMPFLGAQFSNGDNETSCVELQASFNQSSAELNHVEAPTTADADDEEAVEKDNEDDINALMIASSTITNLSRKGPTRAEKKKEKLRREYNATLAMLSPEDPLVAHEKTHSYAQAYFDKVCERLDWEDYQKFMAILNDFGEKTAKISELYKQIESILSSKHQDLLEEFITFLTPAQAKIIGKLIPYYKHNNMLLFLRKLEIYFKEQPAHLRKIYRSLTDLSVCEGVTMEKVKTMILPLLKGNTLLTDWFLQIFPNEPPPRSLLNGSWENVDIRKEGSEHEDIYETITVPEDDDPYGGPNCTCKCHQVEDFKFKTRSQHCIPCGIKFLQGRIYIQTGKGLRLANVSFPGSSTIDHNARLNCSLVDRKKRRSDISPSKQITSPLKECQEDLRTANDSEDDTECNRKRVRLTRSPRKKKIKFDDKLDQKSVAYTKTIVEPCDVASEHAATTSQDHQPSCPEDLKTNEQLLEDNLKIADDYDFAEQNKFAAAEEIAEWDCNTSIESVEVRHSPDHSAESESEFCEESSQDNINTETDESTEDMESLSNSPVHSENSNSNTSEEVSWTRDEDKIILETLQKEGDKEEAFIRIAETLVTRSVLQIKERFNTLMSFLQKMTF